MNSTLKQLLEAANYTVELVSTENPKVKLDSLTKTFNSKQDALKYIQYQIDTPAYKKGILTLNVFSNESTNEITVVVESVQKNESLPFAKDKGLFEKKTKQNAIRYIYSKVNTKGIFRDNDWSGVRKVTDQIRNLGVDLAIGATNDSWHKAGYAVNDKNIPTEKRYDIEIIYKNIDGKDMHIKGQIACQAAGSVNDPLDAYDIVMTLF